MSKFIPLDILKPEKVGADTVQVHPGGGIHPFFFGFTCQVNDNDYLGRVGMHFKAQEIIARSEIGQTDRRSVEFSAYFLYTQKVLMDLHRFLGQRCYRVPNLILTQLGEVEDVFQAELKCFFTRKPHYDQQTPPWVVFSRQNDAISTWPRLRDLPGCLVKGSDELKTFKEVTDDGFLPQCVRVSYTGADGSSHTKDLPIKGLMRLLAIQRVLDGCVNVEWHYSLQYDEYRVPIGIELAVSVDRSRGRLGEISNPRICIDGDLLSYFQTCFNPALRIKGDKKNIELFDSGSSKHSYLIQWNKLTSQQQGAFKKHLTQAFAFISSAVSQKFWLERDGGFEKFLPGFSEVHRFFRSNLLVALLKNMELNQLDDVYGRLLVQSTVQADQEKPPVLSDLGILANDSHVEIDGADSVVDELTNGGGGGAPADAAPDKKPSRAKCAIM